MAPHPRRRHCRAALSMPLSWEQISAVGFDIKVYYCSSAPNLVQPNRHHHLHLHGAARQTAGRVRARVSGRMPWTCLAAFLDLSRGISDSRRFKHSLTAIYITMVTLVSICTDSAVNQRNIQGLALDVFRRARTVWIHFESQCLLCACEYVFRGFQALSLWPLACGPWGFQALSLWPLALH